MLLFLMLGNFESILWRLPAILVALCTHEFAHAFAAHKCGDDTARDQGRLTLNPLAHLDPIGTICLLFAPIGWAKPVPVNPHNFRHPRRDDIIVSAAGPLSNFILAIASFLLLKVLLIAYSSPAGIAIVIINMLYISVYINFALMLFNLLPLFPLDGSHVVQNLLKYPYSEKFAEFSRKAPMILMGIIFLDFFVIRGTLGFSILGTIFTFPARILLDNFL